MNMPDAPSQINYVGGPIGAGAHVSQVYAPGAGTLEGERFYVDRNATPFSPEWLMFYQNNVPLVGRTDELEKLSAFVEDREPFRWWSVHGPAGVGKSRLAHALLEEFGDTWAGAFLASDRVQAGAAANWTPSKDTIWIVDYAAARGRGLGLLLEILARKAAATPYKVRVLLLERDATDASLWLNRLRLDAGHAWDAIRATRFGPSLPLEPIGDRTEELLTRLLVAAGRDEAQAARESAFIEPKQLRLMTADGRPLFVALVAASIVSGNIADMAALTLPHQLLDAQLGREMRLWHGGARSAEHFNAVCRAAFTTTLANGIDIIRSFEHDVFFPPEAMKEKGYEKKLDALRHRTLQELGTASGYDDGKACLDVLENTGLTEHTFWALQPDALGERLLQVLLCPPGDVQLCYANFPFVSGKHIAAAYEFCRSQGRSRMAATLSRLDDETLGSLLGVVATNTDMAMRTMSETVAAISRIRSTPIGHRTLCKLFGEAFFGQRFDQRTARMLANWLDVADASGPAAATHRQQLLDDITAHFAEIGVWLIPHLIHASPLPDADMRQILRDYFANFGKLDEATPDDVIMALRVYRDAVNAKIAGISDTYDAEHFDDPAQPFSVDDDDLEWIMTTFDDLASMAESRQEGAEPDMFIALSKALANSAAQASYLLVTSATQRYLARRDAIETYVRTLYMAGVGIAYSRDYGDRSVEHVCLRNWLSALAILNPADFYHDARKQAFERYRNEHAEQEFYELASDTCKAAAIRNDTAGFCQIMDELRQHTSWCTGLVDLFQQEGRHYVVRVSDNLKSGNFHDVLLLLQAYRGLLCTGAMPHESGILIELFSRLAGHAATDTAAAQALCADLSGFGSLSENNAAFAVHVFSELWEQALTRRMPVHMHGVAVDSFIIDGRKAKRLCGEPARPSAIDSAYAYIHRFRGRAGSPFSRTEAFRLALSTPPAEWEFLRQAFRNPERLRKIVDAAYQVNLA